MADDVKTMLHSAPGRRVLGALDAKVPAPVLTAIVGAAMQAYAWQAGVIMDASSAHMVAGVALSLLSAALALAAMAVFYRARTTINPLDPRRARLLVTGGVYRWSRNPMYLSLLLLLVAFAIRLDAVLVWLGPCAFWAYVTRFQILPEERALAERFGAAYLAYCHRTPRWL